MQAGRGGIPPCPYCGTPGSHVSVASNLPAHILKNIAKLDLKKINPKLDPAHILKNDPNNLDLLARFMYQMHEHLSGGLHWSNYQEKWILKQSVPSSTAAEAFKIKWDATSGTGYKVNCTSCIFEDLSQFRSALLTSPYGNINIFRLVSDYIKKLSISHREPKAPKTCMELVLKAERVYNLLGVPHNVATNDQLAIII